MNELDARYLEQVYKAPIGDHQTGEIEILTNTEVLNSAYLQWAQNHGRTAPYTGIVYQDVYIAVIRDAVRFPSGSLGDYIRVVPKPLNAFSDGVLIIPKSGEEFCFIRTFRHATRHWEIELPRGGIEQGEEPAVSAARELQEETGYTALSMHELGTLYPDSGLIGSSLRVFLAEVSRTQIHEATPETSEAMGETTWFTHNDFLEQIRLGKIRDALSIAAMNLYYAHRVAGNE